MSVLSEVGPYMGPFFFVPIQRGSDYGGEYEPWLF